MSFLIHTQDAACEKMSANSWRHQKILRIVIFAAVIAEFAILALMIGTIAYEILVHNMILDNNLFERTTLIV